MGLFLTGIKTPSICVISPGFQTLDFTAKHVVEQPITGCEVQETLGSLQTEFHIILLHAGSGAQSSASVPVLVEIKFGRSSDNMADIILVLVAEGNVTWRVQTGLRSGMLQVVVREILILYDSLRQICTQNWIFPEKVTKFFERLKLM